MKLTPVEQAHYNRLFRYFNALKKTKQKNLKLFDNTHDAEERKKEILQENFVLECMIVSYQKYITLLALLHDNKMVEMLLKSMYRLLEQKNISDPLDTFKAVQEIIQHHDFQKQFNTLLIIYNKNANIVNVPFDLLKATIIPSAAILLAALGVLAVASSITVSAALIICIVAIPIVIVAYISMDFFRNFFLEKLDSQNKTMSKVDDVYRSLEADALENFTLTETCTYTISSKNNHNINSTRSSTETISTTNKSATELKNLFFSPHNSSKLRDKVLIEYNDLVSQPSEYSHSI